MPCATASSTATLVNAGFDFRIVPQSPGTAAATDVLDSADVSTDAAGSVDAGAAVPACAMPACATAFSRPAASYVWTPLSRLPSVATMLACSDRFDKVTRVAGSYGAVSGGFVVTDVFAVEVVVDEMEEMAMIFT